LAANVSNAKLASNAVQDNVINDGAISGAKLTDDTVTEAKLDIHNAPVDTYLLQYDSANGMTWVAPSAGNTDVDVSVSNLETRLGEIDSSITIGNSASVAVTIAGDLTVSGTTTTVNSTELTVDDKIITVADGGTNAATVGTAGLEVDTEDATQLPFIGFNDGSALSEFVVKAEGNTTAFPLAIMQHAAGTASGDALGVGSFYYDTTSNELYLRDS